MSEKNPDPGRKSRKKRTAWVHVLLFQEERLAWQSKAQDAGLTLADFIRQRVGQPLLLRSRPAPKHRSDPPVGDPELIRQIAWLGNNLNQIARRVNERNISAIEVLVRIAVIERNLKKIIDGTH